MGLYMKFIDWDNLPLEDNGGYITNYDSTLLRWNKTRKYNKLGLSIFNMTQTGVPFPFIKI